MAPPETAEPTERHPSGKRVIVTGASGGIGRETALLFAKAGAQVAVVARRRERLEELGRESEALPGSIIAVVADLAEEAQVRAMVDEAAEKLGGLDILINNAAAAMMGELIEADFAKWRYMFEVNYFGVAAAIQQAIPHLRKAGGGQIINISSTVAKRSMPGSAPYSSSKFALGGLSQGLREELEPEGIKVIVVYPGLTSTEIGGALLELNETPKPRGLWGRLYRTRDQVRRGVPAEHAARAILRASRREPKEAYVRAGDKVSVMAAGVSSRATDAMVAKLYGKQR